MLDNTTAFVTGASQGIGREIALTFAEENANVALAARSDGIYETAEMIGDDAQTLAIKTDVADEDSVVDSIQATVEEFGELNCVVNNAGIAGPTAPIEDIDLADWEQTLQVNTTGAFLTVKHAASYLRESNHGRIINIASIGGKSPYPNRTPYATSKMGMIGLSRTLAFEFGDDNVAVNTICPGPVAGERIETVIQKQAEARNVSYETVKEKEYTGDLALDKMVTPEEVANAAAYLASDRGEHITAQDINIDSGSTWY